MELNRTVVRPGPVWISSSNFAAESSFSLNGSVSTTLTLLKQSELNMEFTRQVMTSLFGAVRTFSRLLEISLLPPASLL